MIHADKLSKLTSSQIINADRLDTINTYIENKVSAGLNSLSIKSCLTKAEIIYFQLYGYKIDLEFEDDLLISWGF